jgi:hypothetical protein
MAEQSSTSRWYGLADSVPEGNNLLAPVGKSEAYKALREQELICYHQLVRVFHMHSADLSKQQTRILEDLRDMFGISASRGEVELAMARADPLVESLRASGVASSRGLHSDGLDDLTTQHITAQMLLRAEAGGGVSEQQSEDDHRQELVLLETTRQVGSRAAAGNSGGASFAPLAAGALGQRKATKTAASAVNAAVSALSNSASELSAKYVRANAEVRATMKPDMIAKLAEAEALLQTLTEIPTTSLPGRVTPRGN